MNRIILMSSVLLAVVANTALADLDGLLKSVARIRLLEGGVGTAWCYEEDETYLYFITAGHVTEGQEEMLLDFYHGAREKYNVAATVLKTRYKEGTALDLGVVCCKKEDFNKYPLPKPIRIAAANVHIAVGQTILSYGCPGGAWPNGWRGYIYNVDSNANLFRVKPRARPGRSGSFVTDATGKYVIGMIIHTDGACVNAKYIRELLND